MPWAKPRFRPRHASCDELGSISYLLVVVFAYQSLLMYKCTFNSRADNDATLLFKVVIFTLICINFNIFIKYLNLV